MLLRIENNNYMRIAALLTCHDRKEKTLKCLKSLYDVCKDCDTYLVDDGCTDGTSDAVKEEFHKVHVIKGDGNLFWSRGMYTAWMNAVEGNYDYYLWLNDDIELFPFFIDNLFESYKLAGGNCVVSGLIGNIKDKNSVLYGGSDKDKKLLGVSEKPQDITFMNGNVVLVPKVVVDKIGIIDPVLHHDLGDVDYGLTALEHGIRVVTTTKIIALGYPNNYCRVRKWGTILKKRFKKLNTPLGSPLKINFYYRKKHFGTVNALLFCSYILFLNILPDNIIEKLYGDTYKDK